MFGDGVGGTSNGGDDGREEEEVGDEVSDDAVGRWCELKVGVCAENGAAVLYFILCGYVICVYIPYLACLLSCCVLLEPPASTLQESSSVYDGVVTIRRWTWKNLSQRRHFIATDFLACLPTFVSLVRHSLSVKNRSIFLGSEVALLANHVDKR